MPMFLRALRSSFSLMAVMSWPSTMTLPAVGRSSMLMQRISVDLPAPLRPMIPKISPRSIVRLIPLSALTGPEGLSYVFSI